MRPARAANEYDYNLHSRKMAERERIFLFGLLFKGRDVIIKIVIYKFLCGGTAHFAPSVYEKDKNM